MSLDGLGAAGSPHALLHAGLQSPVLSASPSPVSAVPRVVAVSPQMRLVEDNPSSLSLVEIYKQRCAKKGIEHDNPISRYYDRLATVQARGTQASHQVWRAGAGAQCGGASVARAHAEVAG